MNSVEKALLTKELSKASAALHNAFTLATRHGSLDLAKSIRVQQQKVADNITTINGGPVKLTAADLAR